MSILSSFHHPWDWDADCPLPRTKSGLQYLITAGSHSCLRGGGITPACNKMPPPQSDTVPTSVSRQVRQQANPQTN